MRLLDCGCGPGGITRGLAAAVAPGIAVGLDLDEDELRAARTANRPRANAHFIAGDAYALPLADAAFDAALAHTVLQHLNSPLAALRELRRVLAPGGLVGISDPLWGTLRFEPTTALLDQFVGLLLAAQEHNGGSPLYAHEQEQLLREVGFGRVVSGLARSDDVLSLTRARRTAGYYETLFRDAVGPIAVEQGWIDAETVAETRAHLRAWAAQPEARLTLAVNRSVGWVD